MDHSSPFHRSINGLLELPPIPTAVQAEADVHEIPKSFVPVIRGRIGGRLHGPFRSIPYCDKRLIVAYALVVTNSHTGADGSTGDIIQCPPSRSFWQRDRLNGPTPREAGGVWHLTPSFRPIFTYGSAGQGRRT